MGGSCASIYLSYWPHFSRQRLQKGANYREDSDIEIGLGVCSLMSSVMENVSIIGKIHILKQDHLHHRGRELEQKRHQENHNIKDIERLWSSGYDIGFPSL